MKGFDGKPFHELTRKAESRHEKEIGGIARRSVPFIACGDHSITLPVLRAMHDLHGKVNLLHLDSHYDFWNLYWKKKFTHGTWLRRAREEGLLKDVVQLGIRGSLFSKEDVKDEVTFVPLIVLFIIYFMSREVNRRRGIQFNQIFAQIPPE